MKQNALDLLQYSIIAYEFRDITHYNKATACIYEAIKLTDKIIVFYIMMLLDVELIKFIKSYRTKF